MAIVTVFAVLAFAGLAYSFGAPLANGLTHLISKLPSYVKSAEHGKGWIGHLVTKYHVQHWVEQNLPKLQSYAKNLSKPALKIGTGALTVGFDVFVVFILVLLLLLEGPKLRHGVLQLFAPARAARVTRIAGEVPRSVTGFMLGNFITSVIAGVVVFVTLVDPGRALCAALGPVGGAARLPAPDRRGPGRHPHRRVRAVPLRHDAIIFAVVFLAYTQIENHVLNPIVMSRTVRINPLLVLIAILVGANIGDLVEGSSGGSWAPCSPSPSPGRSRSSCGRCGGRPPPRRSWRSWELPGAPRRSPRLDVVRVLVVLPTYNEAENIDHVLRRIRAALPDAGVLVVDDGSPDGTANLAEKLGGELGNIEVLRRTAKSGLGSAYRAGFAWGLERGWEAFVEMDADLSHDPEALPSLIAPLSEGVDLVIGSRYVPGRLDPQLAVAPPPALPGRQRLRRLPA